MPIRIAIVNYVWHRDAPAPDATLDRFTTLTGWAGAVRDAGGDVSVFQRFHADADVERGSVRYSFRAEGPPRPAITARRAARLHRAVREARPDLVHVNGFEFPLLIRDLRRTLPRECAIVVQDHGGIDPRRLSVARRAWLRRGLASANALLASAPGDIDVFRRSSLLPDRVASFDVMESSTAMVAVDRVRGREASGLGGAPALLWMGRLNDNKDPLTVLRGVGLFAAQCPGVRLTLVHQPVRGSRARDLEPEVRRAVASHPLLSTRTRVAGEIAHEQVPDWLSAADFFVLGSRREGSGYGVIEALACGLPPVVTDIPSFRALTDGGRVGALWIPGDAGSLCDALARVNRPPLDQQRARARALFEQRFSWAAIGRRAMEIYGEVLRRSGSAGS